MAGKNVPRVKKFLSEAKIGLTPETIWLADEVGTSDGAKKQLKSMFPNEDNVFETPKPEELIKRILEIASNQGDYVLDCFLGSGTTIAVAHKMSRRYVGIEVGDEMSLLVAKRMGLVIEGEQSGISASVNWHGGGCAAFYDFCSNGVETQSDQSGSAISAVAIKQRRNIPEQLLLAIEKKHGYKASASEKVMSKAKRATKKMDAKCSKSIKAKYAKHG